MVGVEVVRVEVSATCTVPHERGGDDNPGTGYAGCVEEDKGLTQLGKPVGGPSRVGGSPADDRRRNRTGAMTHKGEMKMRRVSSKTGLAVLLVVLPLALGIPLGGYAGDEPPVPGAEHLVGPAIMATLTLVEAPAGTLTANFDGTCRNQAVILISEPFAGTIADVTVEALEDRKVADTSQSQLLPCGYPAGRVIINTVIRLVKMNNVATADVIALAVVALP